MQKTESTWEGPIGNILQLTWSYSYQNPISDMQDFGRFQNEEKTWLRNQILASKGPKAEEICYVTHSLWKLRFMALKRWKSLLSNYLKNAHEHIIAAAVFVD